MKITYAQGALIFNVLWMVLAGLLSEKSRDFFFIASWVTIMAFIVTQHIDQRLKK